MRKVLPIAVVSTFHDSMGLMLKSRNTSERSKRSGRILLRKHRLSPEPFTLWPSFDNSLVQLIDETIK